MSRFNRRITIVGVAVAVAAVVVGVRAIGPATGGENRAEPDPPTAGPADPGSSTAGPAASADPAVPGAHRQSPPAPGEEYWTRERMRSAMPAPMPTTDD